jgi:magnesium-transporting ATPase (P-type)
VLPALALGAEPPGAHTLDEPLTRRHLIDRRVFARAFGVLGPVEAFVALAAFLTAFFVSGWRVDEPFPGGSTLLAASGAAFTAVVLGQAANAFACRSTVRPVWRVQWNGNRLLLWATGVELALLAVFLFVSPLADLLDQAPPPWEALLVATLAIPAVVVADAVQKRAVRRHARVSAPRELSPTQGSS